MVLINLFLYNYFRDHDLTIGRYIERDPIGLAGGINTYLYVDGNLYSGADRFGLKFYVEYYEGGKNTVVRD